MKQLENELETTVRTSFGNPRTRRRKNATLAKRNEKKKYNFDLIEGNGVSLSIEESVVFVIIFLFVTHPGRSAGR